MRATQTRKGLTVYVLVKERERSIRFNRELGGERQLQVLGMSSMMEVKKSSNKEFRFPDQCECRNFDPHLDP